MLKIGALSFINALPFFHPFFSKKIALNATCEVGTPTEINTLLEKGKIDVGLISSASFVQRRENYVLLTNLGIGATKQVASVCLYTKGPVTELDGKVVAVPSVSATSVLLLRILCSKFWKVTPIFIEYPHKASLYQLFDCSDAILMIGDECLITEVPSHYQVTDLCTAWYHYTHKPFIFAVFATRCDRWVALSEEVKAFHYALSRAYEYSMNNFDEIIRSARMKTGLSTKVLRNYYSLLEYDLNPGHFHGLECFAQAASTCEECVR